MRNTLFVLFVLCHCIASPQDLPATTEQQLESLAGATAAETEDDSYLQQLEQFRKHPVNLNTADEDELRELHIINDLQIQQLVSYRRLLGKLVDLYELQAIPAWDLGTIRKLLPFITISPAVSVREDFFRRFEKGEHSLLLRISQVLESSKGFDRLVTGDGYLGSPQRLFFRYRYAYKNLVQWGIAADKDAGEQFFKGAQKRGFDFYSIHLFIQKLGSIQALAIGDFTVNMGQGLITWQGLAFGKSAEVINSKHQSPVLRPYSSAGEFNFHRGIGVTLKKGNIELTSFASLRKLSSNLVTDTLNHEDFVSSLLASGYHRTDNEIADRNNLRQWAFGATVKYRHNNWQLGLNAVYYNFSEPISKSPAPYNHYAISGTRWYNLSVDYSYTWHNLHFFGELAADRNFNRAIITGLLISFDPRVDISLLYRDLDKKYQSLAGNAFTENTYPTNEKGFYAGISIRPGMALRLDAYADIYSFPWLRYLADAPGYGKDFLCQLTYTPNKQVEVYTKYRAETKQGNQSSSPTNEPVMNSQAALRKQNWRTQVSYKINPSFTLRNREELIWFNSGENNSEKGFLAFFDIVYNPLLRPYGAILRLQYFETDGYNSRIYAYENDVRYSYSIPGFYDKGYRYYVTASYDIKKNISVWLRWSQTICTNKDSMGTGLDEIDGSSKTEIKLQLRVSIE